MSRCVLVIGLSVPSLDMQSYDLMRLPPREATAEGDLAGPFQQSALKSTADQDPFFQHLKIRYVKAVDTADPPQVHYISVLLLLSWKTCMVTQLLRGYCRRNSPGRLNQIPVASNCWCLLQ